MSATSTNRVKVDWPRCRARGVCHELLPELIDLDPWGFPIVGGAVTADLLKQAKEAVAACPRAALRLTT